LADHIHYKLFIH